MGGPCRAVRRLFFCPEEQIKQIESVLTVVAGKVVYGAGEFARLAPAPLPVTPEWSPVAHYGGYAQPAPAALQSEMRRKTAATFRPLPL